MVTQAPKRTAVMAAVAFTLSCLGLMIFVWTQFGGTVPFAAGGLPDQRRVHGDRPARPERRRPDRGGQRRQGHERPGEGHQVVRHDGPPAPVRAGPGRDARILREKTLLGEAYIELSTGNGAGPKFPDGGTIPATQVDSTQQLDTVLGSFNKPTQQNLQALLNGTFTALAGRGQDLNDAIGNIDPAVNELSAVVGVLNQQQGNVSR